MILIGHNSCFVMFVKWGKVQHSFLLSLQDREK